MPVNKTPKDVDVSRCYMVWNLASLAQPWPSNNGAQRSCY